MFNYRVTGVFVLGALSAIIAIWLIPHFTNAISKLTVKTLGVLIVFLVLMWLSYQFWPLGPSPDNPIIGTVVEYEARIRLVDDECVEFKVIEVAKVDTAVKVPLDGAPAKAAPLEDLRLERQVRGEQMGFLLNKVRIRPFDPNASEYADKVVLKYKNGVAKLAYQANKAGAVAQMFPKNVLMHAQGGEIKITPFGPDKENASWDIKALDTDWGADFTYIPLPYHHFKPVVAPVAGATSFGMFIVMVLGIAAGPVGLWGLSLISPTVGEWAWRKLKAVWRLIVLRAPSKIRNNLALAFRGAYGGGGRPRIRNITISENADGAYEVAVELNSIEVPDSAGGTRKAVEDDFVLCLRRTFTLNFEIGLVSISSFIDKGAGPRNVFQVEMTGVTGKEVKWNEKYAEGTKNWSVQVFDGPGLS